ncbi:hypothetical protein [Streptomyces sp. AS58]|uniref:hypothetical protein n=1 Tax=Streptomyces sp. AS58 TaxID=1519489 RepID=UPI000AF39443|nr:hypothetical protein [Streptomyces sp. AS58]
MRRIEEVIDVLDGRGGMYAMNRTFDEVCAFLDGFDACSELQVMQAFRGWLAERGKGSPELTWWGLVLAEVGDGFRVTDTRSFSVTENEQAIGRLFDLLREFFRDRSEC